MYSTVANNRWEAKVGIGDNLLASGMAKGAAARGRRIAFGDCKKIRWDLHSEQIFRGNPNVAPPGTEKSGNIEWVNFYKGNRLYNTQKADRWIWNYQFAAIPGEVYLSKQEKLYAETVGRGFVVIEPNVPEFKSSARNKQWPMERYAQVAQRLKSEGYDVVQFDYSKGFKISAARQVSSPTFRHGVAVLKKAALYIGPEGGLHHASAAVRLPAVVLFGGFIPPAVTGYSSHTNLTGGAEACGSLSPCKHCKAAMDAISVDEVHSAALQHLRSTELPQASAL